MHSLWDWIRAILYLGTGFTIIGVILLAMLMPILRLFFPKL